MPNATSVRRPTVAGSIDRPRAARLAPLPASGAAVLTSFVGREREAAEVGALLATTRLLTLTGSGGCGKTRLGRHLAATTADAYPDGVWMIELASLADPALLLHAIAAGVGVREGPGRCLSDALVRALQPRQALLILDNCEHLVDACAVLAEGLLLACPRLTILATSREALGVLGELVWLVPSLEAPASAVTAAADLADFPAVRLFVERARLVQPGFALTPQNAAAVAEVCRRLDGIPLAIELAAARLKVLTPDGIAGRLDHCFQLLTGGSRTAMPRHQTLRATVEWSERLLDEAERAVFHQLSVFAGGWTLEAAEAICDGARAAPPRPHSPSPPLTAPVLDLLERLVNKSLVIAEPGPDGAVRYRLLETLRRYAAERLAVGGEQEGVRSRHGAYFVGLAEAGAPALWGCQADRLAWLDRLEVEHDNLRAAARWAEEQGDVEVGLRLAAALAPLWWSRSYLREGRAWIERALAGAAALPVEADHAMQPALARALLAAGVVARAQEDYPAARRWLGASLELYRGLDDPAGLAYALLYVGTLASWLGDFGAARPLLEEALALSRRTGGAPGVGVPLFHLGVMAYFEGDYERSEHLLTRSAPLLEEQQDWYRHGHATFMRGFAALGLGRLDQARAFFDESAAVAVELRDWWAAAIVLEGFASLATARRQAERALRLAGAAEAMRERHSIVLAIRVYAERREEWLGKARRALPEAARAAAWTAGRALSDDEALAEARRLAEPPQQAPAMATPMKALPTSRPASLPTGGRGVQLTRRELEVAGLVSQGLTNRQIAARLSIGERTVDTHVANVLGKLEVATRTRVAAWFAGQGLLAAS
jgi:non-specific serine/threonine protein kinase